MISRPSDAVGPEGIVLLRRDLSETLGHATAAEFADSARLAIEGHSGLFSRARSIVDVLVPLLPRNQATVAALLIESAGAPRERPGYGPMENYRHLVFTRSASVMLADDTPVLLETLRELTMRFTAEFEIRDVLARDYEATYSVVAKWTQDANHHVRRLASEGVRPRLPWSQRLGRYQDDPGDLIKLIAPLRHDPSAYVRRSVANNLADVLKDNPKVGYQTLWQWLTEDENNGDIRRLVRWAIRHPASQGHAEASAFRLWDESTPAEGSTASP